MRVVQALLQMGGWTGVDRITAHEHGLLHKARQTVQPIEAGLQRVQKQKIEPPCWHRDGPQRNYYTCSVTGEGEKVNDHIRDRQRNHQFN